MSGERSVSSVRPDTMRPRRLANFLQLTNVDAAHVAVRIGSGWPFVFIGGGAIIAGGLVAAANSVTPSAHASWAAAYLVLVAGVAQVLLGVGQGLLVCADVRRTLRAAELACWNLGNVAVLVGVLGNFEILLDVGSAALIADLALFALATRRKVPDHQLFQIGYRVLIIVLALSVPSGVLLARALTSSGL